MAENDGSPPRTVVITGGLGNLGSKLCRHLLDQNVAAAAPRYKVVLVEHPAFLDRPRPHPDAIVLPCDLGQPGRDATALAAALRDADALVHFSAVNPYPNASWCDSAQSMDQCFYVFQLAVACQGETWEWRRTCVHEVNYTKAGKEGSRRK